MRQVFNVLLKAFVSFSLSLYFRQWIVKGVSNIPKRQPVIFAANHQNAFLDALVITCSSNRLPYYLARAGIFNSKIARGLLGLIRIMPIYRFRDGLGNVKKNDAIMEACTYLLSKGTSLVMFPEGNHADQWTIRPLQRGISRIALPAEAAQNWEFGIKVVPVGIQYEEPRTFRSRLMVSFGKPIKVSDYRSIYEENPRNGLDALKNDMSEALKEMVVHIPNDRYEEIHPQLMSRRPYIKDYSEQVAVDMELVEGLISRKEVVPPIGDRKRTFNPLPYVLGVWVWINNILPYLFTKWFVRTRIKDPVFTSSIKLACGVVIAPLFHLIVGIALSLGTGIYWLGTAYMFSQPLAGFFGGFDVLRRI